jgi:hypothetical protein
MFRFALGFTIVLLAANLASAAGTLLLRDRMENLLQKYAPNSTTGPLDVSAKTPCRCLANNRAGIVVYTVVSDQLVFECYVPTFRADGTHAISNSCTPFESLGK